MKKRVHEKGGIYKSPDIQWLLEVECAKKEAISFGKKIEKHTEGIVRTHALFVDGENICEPLFAISIEIISKKNDNDIEAFKEIIMDREIKMVHVCRTEDFPKKTVDKYRSAIVEIKKLAVELL